jgi:phosphatidylserine/phosphatidylglycerophosphate/cardiolipin synthase-like enzyme
VTGRFAGLTERDLHELAAALRSGRLAPPFTPAALRRILAAEDRIGSARDDLEWLTSQGGLTAVQAATVLDLLRAERRDRPRLEDVLELVATGPETPAGTVRDTAVVVRELFATASESVLVVGYAVHQGRRIFQALADRMAQVELRVRLFLDVPRGPGETTLEAELIRRFTQRFRTQQWPRDRPIPEVYFDPRSLDVQADRRASLHAKCVVVDNRQLFVSSANFTEAAQQRNVELGILLASPELAGRVVRHFEALVAAGRMKRA